MKCFTGCSLDDVLAKIGLKRTDLYLETAGAGNAVSRPSPSATRASSEPAVIKRTAYEVRKADGELIAVHHRIDRSDGTKRIWWERNGKKGLDDFSLNAMPLYGIERQSSLWSDGWTKDKPIIVTEGEKAAEALWARGLQAVGTVTGASGYTSGTSLADLVGWEVFLWPDNDGPGRRHMDVIGAVLTRMGHVPGVITWPEAPTKGDAADFPRDVAIDDDWINRNAELWVGDPEAVIAAWGNKGQEPDGQQGWKGW